MVTIDSGAVTRFDDDQFTAVTTFQSDRLKLVIGCFEPGQFIPVHAPDSDLVVRVRSGRGLVHDAGTDRAVEPGDLVVVPAGERRGIEANADERLTALLVTAPPPTDAEHDPVREGLRKGEFHPER